jgi:hypothetical protein
VPEDSTVLRIDASARVLETHVRWHADAGAASAAPPPLRPGFVRQGTRTAPAAGGGVLVTTVDYEEFPAGGW